MIFIFETTIICEILVNPKILISITRNFAPIVDSPIVSHKVDFTTFGLHRDHPQARSKLYTKILQSYLLEGIRYAQSIPEGISLII